MGGTGRICNASCYNETFTTHLGAKMIDTRKYIGLTLKEARTKKRLNQQSVADAIGTNRKAISKIENGTYIGAFGLLERYLDYLGFEFSIKPKPNVLPTLDNVHDMFKDDDE